MIRWLCVVLMVLVVLPVVAQDADCEGINCACVKSYLGYPLNARSGPDEQFYDIVATLEPGDCVEAVSVYYNRHDYTQVDTWNAGTSLYPRWSGHYPVWIAVRVWVPHGIYLRPKTVYVEAVFVEIDPCAEAWIDFIGLPCHVA